MSYDPKLVQPMREELTRRGVQELRTAAEVDEVLGRRELLPHRLTVCDAVPRVVP